MEEIKGHEEKKGHRRVQGTNHGAHRGKINWLDRRTVKGEFETEQPAVVIVGAGQGGLALAARLGQLGVDTLLVERNDRIGDSWRKRYHSLVLHDPVWYDHLPYLNFPRPLAGVHAQGQARELVRVLRRRNGTQRVDGDRVHRRQL